MIEPRRNRVPRALAVVFFSAPLLLVIACTETRRGLGEECLKGEDCISNLCVAQQCASAPPVLQGTSTVSADGAVEGSATIDASDSGETLDTGSDVFIVDSGDASD